MTDIVMRMKCLPDLTNEEAWAVVHEGAREIERLRYRLLNCATSASAVTAARHAEKSEGWQEGFDRGGNAAADAILEIINPQQSSAA